MTDHGVSLNEKCPCQQKFCAILGNCVLCVQNHLDHRRHVPECFQDILRDKIRPLADLMELKTEEGRPDDEALKKQAKTDFVERSIAKHRKQG